MPAGGDLVLLHGLQQRRLGLGRGAVDLVGQDDIGEDRPLDEAEGPPAGGEIFLDDLGAGDVAGHEVGGELHPIEAQVQRLGHRLNHQGLGQTGNADQQGVPAAEDRGEDAVHHVFLAHDPLGHLAS